MKIEKFFAIISIATLLPLAVSCSNPTTSVVPPQQPVAAPDTAPAQPYQMHQRVHPWPHQNHSAMARPTYGFEWDKLKSITCSAVNAHGEEFVVIDNEVNGHDYQVSMNDIEDASVDRCLANAQADKQCQLRDCTPNY